MTKKLFILALLICLSSASAQDFQQLFNGKDLSGWKGVAGFWRVENGAIVGETTKENPTLANMFLIWQGGEVEDFEFSCQVRFSGNNSGVQYRSEVLGDRNDFALRGYQADLHPRQDYFGMLYGEKFGRRGVIAKRGQRVDARGDKDVEILGTVGDGAELKGEQWNTLRIVAVGNRLIHLVNDVVTVDVTESHPAAIAKGHLGLQLHRGAPMKVAFKGLRYRKLAGDDAQRTLEVAINGKRDEALGATPSSRIRLPEGFKIERLYSVPPADQGSWVAMCQDDKGRLIVSDQYGGLFRIPIPKLGQPLDPSSIERITWSDDQTPARKGETKPEKKATDPALMKLPNIGHAQGLCYAFDSLYVVVNSRRSETGSGVFRLLDTDGDDQFDKIVTIKTLAATGGEHGPHAILPAPDGKHLYVVMGNQTQLPEDYTHSRVPEVWAEDQLFPSLQHFMKGAEAPLGHVAQIDPEGKTWEIIATGFRNQYDAAVNREGELFTWDADMEWDLNTPWYRPTRVNHVIDGAEFGWRTGSGKFMDYCSDTFGAVTDIGPGSPTGVCFGYGAKFPAKYQNAFFICDWSYGKLYAVHMKPKGSTYTGTFEEFAAAQPLPLTDILVNPEDGAMYFTVGGRRVQSGLYRVTYTGDESTAPAKSISGGEKQRQQRHALEAWVQKGAANADAKQLDRIWISLGSRDRGIRHAARVALEKQPIKKWKGRLNREKNPVINTAALIALARTDGKNSSAQILKHVMRFDYATIKGRQLRLDVLRGITLALTRGGQPSVPLRKTLITWLDNIYPARTPEENRDLSAIMAFLQAPSAVEKGMQLLAEAAGQEEQIGYALNLRHLKQGWTPKQRELYFRWFVLSGNYSGGARLKNYLADIKKHAVASVPKSDMTPALRELIDTFPKDNTPVFTLEPREFVKEWTMADLKSAVGAIHQGGRNYKNGRQMTGVGACYACHRFKGEGGAVGPDLTSVGGKFSAHDLLESIIHPGKEISDQYGASNFNLKNDTVVSGRVMNMKGNTYWVNTDMMTPSTITNVKAEDLKSIETSPVSMMPAGLVNLMSKDDILDLLAYLISGGDLDHELFKN
jgi:putative heme-binding domain-containing protein